MIDLEAAREAAASVVAGLPIDQPEDAWIMRAEQAARALLWLTDPTPLTWELVRAEPGWSDKSERSRRIAINGEWSYVADWTGKFWLSSWHGGEYNKAYPQPTTLGELRQVMMRAGAK